MKEITIERSAVNIESLDAELRAALGTSVSGLSVARGRVTVHLADTALDVEVEQARQLVIKHDPAALTPQQQQAQRQAAKLASARQANTADLDTAKFIDPLLSELAAKVAWLEQEILALRSR